MISTWRVKPAVSRDADNPVCDEINDRSQARRSVAEAQIAPAADSRPPLFACVMS